MSIGILNFDHFANVSQDDQQITRAFYDMHSKHKLGLFTNKIYNESIELIKKCFFGYEYIEFIPGGASLANKKAILGSISYRPKMINGVYKDIVLISSIEHTSIINYISAILLNCEYTVLMIPCDNNGIISTVALKDLLIKCNKRIALVSIMNVNNETGIIQNINEYIKLVKTFDDSIIFHSDITCGLNEFWNSTDQLKPDILTFSGYKLAGPHFGVVVSKLKLVDDHMGTGTLDVGSINVLAKIISNKYNSKKSLSNYNLKTFIINELTHFLNTNNIKHTFLSCLHNSVDNVVSLLLYGFQVHMIQQILSQMDICIGTGSAYQSNNGSHVIRAMGYSIDASFNLIRISWGDIIDISCMKKNQLYQNYAELLVKTLSDIILQMHPLVKTIEIYSGTHLLNNNVNHSDDVELIQQSEANQLKADYDITKNFEYGVRLVVSEIIRQNNFELNNLKQKIFFRLTDYQIYDFEQKDDKITIIINYSSDIINILKQFSEIISISEFYRFINQNNEQSFNKIINCLEYLYSNSSKGSFAIRTLISQNLFLNYKNREMNYMLGQILVDKYKASVDLKNPDIEFIVVINSNKIYIFFEKHVI